jgi:hypothetical protein
LPLQNHKNQRYDKKGTMKSTVHITGSHWVNFSQKSVTTNLENPKKKPRWQW